MKKSKTICWIVIVTVAIILFQYRGIRFSSNPKVQEGDVIFHMSTSSQ